jgi:hypothetical protein
MHVDPEILRQIDNAIRHDFRSWSDLYFHLLICSSILVGLGVALEGPEVVHEARNIRRTCKREARAWVKLVGLVGWIFVVVGVAGEGIFEAALSIADDQIQTFDEILLTAAQRDAGNASLSADRAAADEKQLSAALDDAVSEGLELKRALDDERARHSPRHVTPAQGVCMQAALKGLSNQKIKMAWYRSSREQYAYASEIALQFSRITGGTIDTDEEEGFPDRTGILMEGGSVQLSSAVYKALNCLVPSGAPKISGGPPGSDSNQELQIFVFPDTSRSPPPR